MREPIRRLSLHFPTYEVICCFLKPARVRRICCALWLDRGIFAEKGREIKPDDQTSIHLHNEILRSLRSLLRNLGILSCAEQLQ